MLFLALLKDLVFLLVLVVHMRHFLLAKPLIKDQYLEELLEFRWIQKAIKRLGWQCKPANNISDAIKQPATFAPHKLCLQLWLLFMECTTEVRELKKLHPAFIKKQKCLLEL